VETPGQRRPAPRGVVSNHHENRDAKETFSIPLAEQFSRVEGELEVNGYLVISMEGERTVRIHANGRSDRKSNPTSSPRSSAPRVEATPVAGLLRSGYDNAAKAFSCVSGFQRRRGRSVVTAG